MFVLDVHKLSCVVCLISVAQANVVSLLMGAEVHEVNQTLYILLWCRTLIHAMTTVRIGSLDAVKLR